MRRTFSEVQELAAELLTQAGLTPERAQTTARVLAIAEVWGLGSHGLLRLPVYLDRITAGGHPVDAKLKTVTDTGPLVTLNGHGGLGHWQLHEAAELAAERAGRFGIAAMAVANSGHCGALGVYAADLAQKGLVSLVFSNGPAVLPPWGGTQKLLSTSPIAAGFPLDQGPVIIDLALSTVARGKIASHAQSGIPLADGWALDSAGHPTTDPVAALSGMLSPLGGAKGFALAFMVEALTGGIIGPLLSADVPDFFDPGQSGRPQRIAHLVVALDPAITDGTGNAAAGAGRLADLAERTEAAGGRVPGSRRRPVSIIQPDDHVDVDDVLWAQLIERTY